MKKRLAFLFQFLLITSTLSQTTEQNITEISTVNGQKHYGYILHATDSLLFLWQSQDSFNSDMIEEFVTPFYFFDLERVRIKKEGHFWPTLKNGALIGGGASVIIFILPPYEEPYSGLGKAFATGIVLPTSLLISGIIGGVKNKDDIYIFDGKSELYHKILPNLKKNAIFPNSPPSELQLYVDQKFEKLLSKKPSPEILEQLSKRFYPVKISNLHILIGSGLIYTKADNDMLDAFKSSVYSGEQTYPDPEYPSFFSFEVEYNLTNKYRFGVEWNSQRMRRICAVPIWEEADRSSISFIFDYTVLQYNSSILKKYEFVIGTGLNCNYLSINQTITVREFEMDKKVFGGCLRASFDYYLWNDFSVQLKLTGRLMPSIDVPERNYENYTLKQHQVNFSAIDISFGIRIHF